MKNEAVIKLMNINEHLLLTGKVEYLGRVYWITKSGKYFVDDLPENEEVFTIPLSKTAPTHRITWDDTPHPDPERAKKGGLARVMDETYRMIATLWQYHKQIRVLTSSDPKINEGKKAIRFTYEHINKRHTNKLIEIRKKAQAVNRILDINDSSIDALVDVAYYFLPAVASKKHTEIVTALIDPQSGFLLQEPNLTNFLAYKDNDPDIIYLTHVKKAIALKLIEDKKEAGYWLNGQYAGMHHNAVSDYLKANEKLYNALVKDIRGGELIIEDEMPVKEMVKKNDEKLIENHQELDALRKKAQDLGIKSYHVLGEEKLKAKIAEVEKLQEEIPA